MSRLPSEATQLRNLKAQLKRAEADISALMSKRDEYRARATKAEQDASEWKARFDTLLERDSQRSEPKP